MQRREQGERVEGQSLVVFISCILDLRDNRGFVNLTGHKSMAKGVQEGVNLLEQALQRFLYDAALFKVTYSMARRLGYEDVIGKM